MCCKIALAEGHKEYYLDKWTHGHVSLSLSYIMIVQPMIIIEIYSHTKLTCQSDLTMPSHERVFWC